MGKLTAAAVRGLRTPGKHLDGDGLALSVRPGGQRYWIYRYQRAGVERTMTLGNADTVSLADARKAHAKHRAVLLAGQDPLEERDRAAMDLSRRFDTVAEAYVVAHEARWRRTRNARAWRASIRDHVSPKIGRVPVSEVDVAHILKVLRPLWAEKPVTGDQVRSRLEATLDFAVAMGWRAAGANPASWRGNLRLLLPAKAKLHVTRHHEALDWREMPAFMTQLRERDSMASRVLQFIVYTAARSAEAREAPWSEVDLQQALWVVPAARMKGGKEHRVPLSEPALRILRSLADVRNADGLVFPGAVRGRPLSGLTLKDLLRQLGHGQVTVHGFRSSFRDWCADCGKAESLAEAALAHVAGSATVRAYARSDLLEARRSLMEQWSDYLTGQTGVVVPLRAAGPR